MYSLPQEIEVWYIIPAIRKELSKILTSKYDLTYEKTGNILGISKAAVSQYLKNKRASKFNLTSEIKKEIEKSAEIINNHNDSAIPEILRLLNYIKKSKCSCELCKKYNNGIIKFCNMNPDKWEQ